MKTTTSEALFARAQRLLPGGVNSPVRAFRAVGGDPLFIARAAGARIWDEDGNELIDYVGSWGPMILGHAHPAVVEAVSRQLLLGASYGAPTRGEVEIAELVARMVPGVEMIRMVSSGTEATQSAVRLARGATGRAKVVKFEGCYHGHGDSFLIRAGSGAATFGQPDSPGVTEGTARDTLLASFGAIESVRALFSRHAGAIAAVIVEPVVGNMGVVKPRPGFLEGLSELCSGDGALLIFDEVMTGFRLAPGGAQERFGIRPDLTTLGKILGGGLPAAFAALTLTLPYNDLDAVRDLMRREGDAVACVVVEPVAGNMGVVPPAPGFLEGLREVTEQHGALLIFDEVITGFRVSLSGAQGLYGIRPDLTILGKILGGGFPLAAYGGRREVMQQVAPVGPVYQAGTLSGNPLAVAAGLATLSAIEADSGFYERLEASGAALEEGIAAEIKTHGYPCRLSRCGSMWTLFFSAREVQDWAGAAKCDTALFARWFRGMLERGVYCAPSQFEANFISIAHTDVDIEATVRASAAALEETFGRGR